MLKQILHKEEQKVRYIELIYDLIFVYIVGRNNSLLHHFEDGFITFSTFSVHILTTLIVLHVWYYTTLFLNRYGTDHVIEYIGLFVNMYLLYYMADSTNAAWQDQYTQYNVAWALILINMAIQYFARLKRCTHNRPLLRRNIIFNVSLLLGEAAIVLISIPIYLATGVPLSPVAMVLGLLAVLTVGGRFTRKVPVDFAYLSERVMLYVVFTFGEMIIGISGYFGGGFTVRNVYFSLMGFLIVTGLFLIYGYYYDHIVDRERETNGIAYMMVHILLITTLNNITAALEFMREPEVDEVKKNAFLVVAFVLYFGFLLLIMPFAKSYHKPSRGFLLLSGGLTAVFVVMMAAFYRDSVVSIAVTVVYIYAMFLTTVIFARREHKKAVAQLQESGS